MTLLNLGTINIDEGDLINTSTKKGLTKKENRYFKKILRKAEKRWKIKQKRF